MVDIKQGTDEWYAARKSRITGSNVGAILGLNPWRTADDVMRAMVRDYHGAESEFSGNVATEYGTFHEGGAKQDYEMETGNDIEEAGFYVSDEYEWLGASPDGFVNNGKLIEIKCPYGQRDKNPPKFKSINDQMHYYAQIQIQLFVLDTSSCDFYQWSQYGTMLEVVHYDDAWLDENIPKLEVFYKQFLKEIDNPDHLKPRRKQINTATASLLIDEYDDLQEVIDRANERKKEVLSELVDMAGSVDSDICGRKLTKVVRKGSISYAKAVKDHLPDLDLSQYEGKPSEFWKLS